MRASRLPAVLLAALLLSALPLQLHAEDAATEEAAYVHAGLGAVERWEREVYGDTSRMAQVDLDSKLMSLLEELTRLHEVVKLPQALPHIKRLLRRHDVPERCGFAAGGMLAASLQRMELKNEAFAGYSMFFVRIENRTGAPLRGGEPAVVTLHLVDGSQATAETVDESHELYPQVSRILGRFRPPARVAPAAEASFFAAFPRPGLTMRGLAYATLAYGGHRFVIKCYENLP